MSPNLLRVLCLGLVVGCTSAHATLVGDTITLTHQYVSTVQTTNVLVQAGTGDSTLMLSYYTVNPEASSILVQFLGGANQWGTGNFNGLVVSGINDTITGVSVSTNLAGWNNNLISFDAHSISSNWQGLPFSSTSFFDITFSIQASPSSVPDSGTTAGMLALATVGLAALRRRRVN